MLPVDVDGLRVAALVLRHRLGVYQPIVFAGQYRDEETAAYLDDGVTVHRPALILNGHRTYDPFTGGYLQLDPLVKDTWSPYTYADNDPVGKDDPTGLATAECQTWSCSGKGDGPIEVQCTCTEYAPSGPTGREFAGGGHTGNGPRGRELGGGAGGGRGAARTPRTPRNAPRKEFPLYRLPTLEASDQRWFEQCSADIMTGLSSYVERMGMVLELETSRWRRSTALVLGSPANFVPPRMGEWGGMELELGGESYSRENLQYFCNALRGTIAHFEPRGMVTEP